MSFEKFLEQAWQIVSAHSAEYQGVYYMKGGFFGEAEQIGTDIALTATGNPEFIPLANAAETTVGGVVQGESIGKALGQGAIAGGEALAGQEIAGAVGIGEGNTAFNNALGITGDNPAGTGLPDIGGAVDHALGSASDTFGLSGSGAATAAPGDTLNDAGAAINPSTGQTMAAPASTTITAPASGGGGVVSPSNAGTFGADAVNSSFDQSLTQGTNLGTGINATSPSLGTLSGSAADSALGAAGTDAIGSTGATAAKSAASAGGSSLMSTIENTAIKGALPLAGLAYSAIQGPAALPADAKNLQSGGAATAPLLAMETAGANEAATGQLTAPQQASVLQYVQQSQNQLLQQLASSGVQNPTQDSRYIQGMQKIQQDALALQNQYITQAITEATQAGGAASSNIASVANEQIQQDTAYQQALAAAFGALGMSLGGGINVNRPAAS